MTKAESLPSSAFCCAPSPVLRTPRTSSRLRATSAIRPYTPGLCPTWLPGRISPVPRYSVPTCHRLRPRRGPAPVPVQDAVCCLRRDMIGSALPNTFRLIILTRLQRSPVVAARWLAPLCFKGFRHSGAGGLLRSAGVCYRALRRLPGRDFSPARTTRLSGRTTLTILSKTTWRAPSKTSPEGGQSCPQPPFQAARAG
jgi:hypothetical protein